MRTQDWFECEIVLAGDLNSQPKETIPTAPTRPLCPSINNILDILDASCPPHWKENKTRTQANIIKGDTDDLSYIRHDESTIDYIFSSLFTYQGTEIMRGLDKLGSDHYPICFECHLH